MSSQAALRGWAPREMSSLGLRYASRPVGFIQTSGLGASDKARLGRETVQVVFVLDLRRKIGSIDGRIGDRVVDAQSREHAKTRQRERV